MKIPHLKAWSHLGLRGKFVVLYVALLGSFVIAMTITSTISEQHSIKENLQAKAHSLASLIATTSPDLIDALDVKRLRISLADVCNQQDVMSGFIFDNDGFVLTDGTDENIHRGEYATEPAAMAAAEIQAETITECATQLQVAYPIYLGENRVGAVHLVLSKQRALAAMRETRNQNLMLGLLFVGLGVVLTNFRVQAVIGSIQEVIRGTDKLSRGNFKQRINCKTDDELQVLASAFNRMAGELEQTYELIEQKVQLRTREVIASRRETQLIVDNAPDAVITADISGVMTGWNPQAEIIFGWTHEQAVGQPITKIIPESDRSKHQVGWNLFLETGESSIVNQRFEITGLHKDGHEIPIEATFIPIITGESVSLSAFIRDLTETKKREENIKALNRQLIDAARSAGMAEITSGVLHNVGNVLTSVNVSARLLDQTWDRLPTNRLAQSAELIQSQEDLSDFFNNDRRGELLPGYLADLSEKFKTIRQQGEKESRALLEHLDHVKSVIASQQSLAKGTGGVIESVQPEIVIKDAVKLIQNSYTRNNIDIDLNLAPFPEVLIDRHKILQILVNLLKNANESVVEFRDDDRRVQVNLIQLDDETFSISVVDNGIGIEPENMCKIFSHGFTTKADGHGFGLHACALAAKEMDGSLSVQSSGRGYGAKFQLALPLKVGTQTSIMRGSDVH